MKKNILLILLGIILISCSGKNNTTKTFTVYGNCSMCKSTIEKSVKNIEGIKTGVWDLPTDQMTVEFDPSKISLDDIKQKIADVGYDSDTHRAKDDVYNSLPGCCQYERPTKLKTETGKVDNLKEESFVVYGNCTMCKSTIEKAAKENNGVQFAVWDLSKDIVTIKYDSSKTSRSTIEESIAASGYDTENLIAPDEVYNNLPGCCRYTRMDKEKRTEIKKYATKYAQGNIDNDDMHTYAMELTKVHPYKAHQVASKYLSINTNWNTKKNMELISLVATDYQDPLFTYMLDNRDRFRKVLDEKDVDDILISSITDHYTVNKENVHWGIFLKKLKHVFSNNPKHVERVYVTSRLNYFAQNDDNKNYFKEAELFLTNFTHKTAQPYGAIAYGFNSRTDDTKLLTKAFAWAKKAAKMEDKSFFNLVAASIAKKLKLNKESLSYANKALKLAKQEENSYVEREASNLINE